MVGTATRQNTDRAAQPPHPTTSLTARHTEASHLSRRARPEPVSDRLDKKPRASTATRPTKPIRKAGDDQIRRRSKPSSFIYQPFGNEVPAAASFSSVSLGTRSSIRSRTWSGSVGVTSTKSDSSRCKKGSTECPSDRSASSASNNWSATSMSSGRSTRACTLIPKRRTNPCSAWSIPSVASIWRSSSWLAVVSASNPSAPDRGSGEILLLGAGQGLDQAETLPGHRVEAVGSPDRLLSHPSDGSITLAKNRIIGDLAGQRRWQLPEVWLRQRHVDRTVANQRATGLIEEDPNRFRGVETEDGALQRQREHS